MCNFTSVKLDRNKLTYNTNKIRVYNLKQNLIEPNIPQLQTITEGEVPPHVINAFTSIEDKTFYKHKGVNYKRIIKASLKNLQSKSLKEGASTITQQVIKNTHLTNEKTLQRKINELLLAQKLEKTLTKNEIMTAYLNAIYFGGGAFGISNASMRYFNKEPSNLTLEESATLAGIIKSPNKYSPITNYEACKERRNLVLKEMYADKKITKQEYEDAKNSNLTLNVNQTCLGNNSYYSATITEACNILNLTEKDLLLKNLKIYTYQDETIQKIVDEEISNVKNYINAEDFNSAILSINNSNGGINAFCGKSNYEVLSLLRQPGSTLKPIICYAPALENGIINPITPILDEKISINGYNPKNYNNVYHGWTSATNCLAKSLNCPSVKLLNYVGLENAKAFAKKLGVTFSSNDIGYSLALGGMTNGIKIRDLANCYQCFANNGKYIKCNFIKEIRTSDNKLIYKHNETSKQVMKDSTAYLLNTMLRESVKTGTCKKLNLAEYNNICAKTGTVGHGEDGKNSDVWSLSYTPENTLCVWLGSNNNNTLLPKNITGSTAPTFIAQNFYKKANLSKTNFSMPPSVEEHEINLLEYTNNQKIILADNTTPERFKLKALFDKTNKPTEVSTMFNEISPFNVEVKKTLSNNITITFKANNYLEYDVIRKDDDNITTISHIKNKNEQIIVNDSKLQPNTLYTYYVIARYNSDIISHANNNYSKKSNETKILLA